eukprot:4752930-Prymnesium_polylepis.1
MPSARYLIALNAFPFWTKLANDTRAWSAETVANSTCPAEPATVVGLYDSQFKPLLVTPLRRERDLEFGALSADEVLADPNEGREEASAASPGSTTPRSR